LQERLNVNQGDAFLVLGFAVIGALLLMLLLRDPPSHLEQTAHGRQNERAQGEAYFVDIAA
jgi:hypothetical protein